MDYYHFYHGAQSDNASVSNNAQKKKKKTTKVMSGGVAAVPVKLSTDPQSVAARERRHRISERFKTLQSLVPGGAKLDTVSMLDEAIHYVKFLKTQIWLHETLISNGSSGSGPGDACSDSLHTLINELHYCPKSTVEWSTQPSLDEAALYAGASSWVYDQMAEVQTMQFGNGATVYY